MAASTAPRSRRYTPPAARARARVVSRTVQDAPARAPVGRRLVAALVDLALVPVAVLAVAEALWRTGALRLAGVSPAGWIAWSWSFGRVAWTVAAAALAYNTVGVARWGGTVGTWVAGLRVETADGGRVGPLRALGRGSVGAAVYLPSVLAPVLVVVGWVTVAVGERRSPADRAAGTRVVRSVRAVR
jgi:uncharacterized RDD family membrane protein YckC